MMSNQSNTKMHVLLRMGGYHPLPESLENNSLFLLCIRHFCLSLPFTNGVLRSRNSVALLDLLSSGPTVLVDFKSLITWQWNASVSRVFLWV